MSTMKTEEYSMATLKAKKKMYCKRCGVETKAHFQIQIEPAKIIKVCTDCFNWAGDKTMAEIRKDYKERARRKKNGK